MENKIVIVVEGNIGSGKTTILKNLEEQYDVDIFYEPVSEWENVKGHNILDLLYKDSSRWSFSFQMYILYTRTKVIDFIKNSKKNVIFIDRSIIADYTFVNTLYDFKLLSDVELAMYDDVHNWLINFTGYKKAINGVIYLNVDSKKCSDRIKKRARTEECSISDEYLKKIDYYHQDVLKKLSDKPTLILDNNKDEILNDNIDNILKWIDVNFKVKL